VGGQKLQELAGNMGLSLSSKIGLSLLQLTRVGQESVIIFFVVSGFSIAYSLQKQSGILGFYKRRFIRLYPPYILGILWAICIFLIVRDLRPDFFTEHYSVKSLNDIEGSANFLSLSNLLKSLFFLPQGTFIFQYWSLTYEVIFYLLAPFIMLNLRFYFKASLVFYLLGWFLDGAHHGEHTYLKVFLLSFNIYFAIGIWAFVNWDKLKPKLALSKMKFFLISMLLFVTMLPINLKFNGINKITAAIASLLTLLLIVNFHTLKIDSKFFKFLGQISYTLYVTHVATIFLIMTLIFTIFDSFFPYITSMSLWLTSPPICVLVAWLFYFLGERPSKRLLTKIRNER